MEHWERIALRARAAGEAAALRGQEARRRREQSARRVTAIQEHRAHGQEWVETAIERAVSATRAIHVAQAHAAESLDRSAEAHAASARAHDRAAEAADSVADDAAAARHRSAAAEARQAATDDAAEAEKARSSIDERAIAPKRPRDA
jgi:hypothetical protein